MILIINQLIVGLMLGILYALIASGYSLFYGVLRVVNFSHADVCFLGAFISMAIISFFSKIKFLPIWLLICLALCTSIFITGLFGGMLFEKLFIKRFRKSPGLIMLLSTVAAGFIIREGIKMSFYAGASPKLFPLHFPELSLIIGGLTIRMGDVTLIVIALLIYFFLALFINNTKIGLQIRATSQNMEAAQIVGIDLDKIYSITFILASMIGCIAGILNGMYFSVIKYDMGQLIGIIGFAAAIMGGLGSIYGAVLGGLILGLVESLTSAFIPGGSPYKEIFAFLVVIFFLLFKPSGILGRKSIEKV